MQYALGVDLGTTYTAAAVYLDGRVEMVPLGVRHAEMPSLIYQSADGRTIVGESAERHGLSDPARLVREVKRRLGDPVSLLVGGTPYSAHALLARLLRHVLDTVTARHDAPPARVVVTHPANWGPYKREQLDQVFRGAGRTDVRTVTEPEAAAIHLGSTERVPPGQVIGVYDLGGGTFDAAVLRRTGDRYAMLGTPEGIEQLGGADFDDAVFGHVAGVLGSAMSGLDLEAEDVRAALARLRRECVEGKEALSYDTSVDIGVALPGLHTRVRLVRAEFEGLIGPALDDTVRAMRRALDSAGVAPDRILLSGGSSRIPLVAQVLTAAFDRPVALDPHPEHSVALGAARLAGRDLATTGTTAPPPGSAGSGASPRPGPPAAAVPPSHAATITADTPISPPGPATPTPPGKTDPTAAGNPPTPGPTPSGPTPPSTTPSGTTPPGTTPSGPTPPSTTPSGTTPSGTTPPGTTPPGTTPPGGAAATPPRSAAAAPPGTAATAPLGHAGIRSTTAEMPAVRGVASVPPPPAARRPGSDVEEPAEDDPARARTRRRLLVAGAFFAVVVSTGATAWALQSDNPGPGDGDDGERVTTAGSAAVRTSATPGVVGTLQSSPVPSRSSRTPADDRLSVSVRLSAERTSTDEACDGFDGLPVRARISADRPAAVRFRWHDDSGTLHEDGVGFTGADRRTVDYRYGHGLAPGESVSADLRITVTSPAGSVSKSIRLSLSCPGPTEPPPPDPNPSKPNTSPAVDPDPSLPPADED
ncbi:Hsp70 family protein [Jidongwangia harbinensis]|uniref:Hsp70 family protein n=1 Tax=Jidongwangia harbinensis TaxID=2878561 RepID=UPI001CD9FB8A|nr:Hsp70 family protein [Jidongwangia harbinensis]MCA2214327.1 Hsp70 family protein [Jidongwangia harbinensis]